MVCNKWEDECCGEKDKVQGHRSALTWHSQITSGYSPTGRVCIVSDTLRWPHHLFVYVVYS